MEYLAQWNDIFSTGRLQLIRSAGQLGVELTYLLNAYFYTKSYEKHIAMGKKTYKFVLKQFLRLIPIYYLGLILYSISMYLAYGNLGATPAAIISHFLFLNGLRPGWYNAFMGGAGYFGVLSIMWVMYPVYIRRVKNLRDSVIWATIFCSITYMITHIFRDINAIYSISNSGNFDIWLWYMNRGFYSFALGNVLYYAIKENLIKFENDKVWKLFNFASFFLVIGRIYLQGSGFDGFTFTLVFCIIICGNYNKSSKVIDNPIFAFCGRYITELFVLHIDLYYILVLNQKIIEPGWAAFLIIFILSVVIAPWMNKFISKPLSNLLLKLLN